MTNSKATKKALLSSVLVMLVCVTMLIGTTFAWFTDNSSTNVNKIQSGTLDVELEMLDGENWVTAEGKTLDFVKADGSTTILWEPGATYELPQLRVTNKGNLALKYKIVVNGTTGDAKLLEAIEFTVDGVSLDEEFHLSPNTSSEAFTIKGHFKEDAGNEYQGLELDGISITVYATQYTEEYDSYDNQYDKDAEYMIYPVYPAGVETDSFPESVEYTTWTGASSTTAATAAYVDASGNVQYVADITDAIEAGATTVYVKENVTVSLNMSTQTNRTTDLTKDLTIYANGADFQHGTISMNMTETGKAANITLEVHDAKNIYVWGSTPNDGVTQTVTMENCNNEGTSATDSNGRMFYITGTTGTVNVTLRNCSVTKAESPVYMKNNGSVTLECCKFSECAAAVKISHKATGTCDVTIIDTTFDKCGWTEEVSGQSYLTEDSSSIKCKTNGTLTLTLNNVAITNVVGSNSILIDGDTGYTGTTSVNATNVTVDGVAWTNN